MRSDWLANWLGNWPKDLPRLYPQLDDRLLSCFLSDAEYRSILKMPRLAVLPLWSERSTPLDRAFGAGLARLLIRDLMLVDTLSVHGPQETPNLGAEAAAAAYPVRGRGAVWISGVAHIEEGLCKVDFQVLAPGKEPEALEVRGSMLREFVSECSNAVAEVVGGRVTDTIRQMWTGGRPANVVHLLNFGGLLTQDMPGRQRSREAMQLWAEDMDFSTVLQAVGEHEPKYRIMLIEGHRRDPYNVALMCQLFGAVRETKGHEPYAVQFTRKAIELSPGCGRAHLLFPDAAHPEANLLRHAELAYRLLPGHLDGVCAYLAASCRANRSAKELTDLVREAINFNPYDPENYHRVIDTFVEVKQFRHALDVAKGLQQLFEPEIHPRTRQAIQQDPKSRHVLEAGHDPVRDVRALVRQLRESIASGPDRPVGPVQARAAAGGI